MNKAGKKLKNFFTYPVLSVACFFILSTLSCGLDTYPFLYAPSAIHSSYYLTPDWDEKYFCFYTADSTNYDNSSVSFTGTEVYYKIFNNYSTLSSYRSAVSTLINDKDYTSAAEKIIDTQKYKTLKLTKGSITPLVKSYNGNNRYVYIRLTDYGNTTSAKAGICINPNSKMTSYDEKYALKYNGTIVYPRRYVNSTYTFNFGGDNTDYDKVPTSSDEDVCYSDTSTEEGTWYVSLYAISVGIDTSVWTRYYSEPIPLGEVSIKEGEDN